jgi:hypothetical protein
MAGRFCTSAPFSNGELMSVKERKTVHSPRCAECGEMLFCEFDDEELKQLVAGTLSFICSNSNAHKSRIDNSWSPTKEEKDAFVEILFSN